MKKLLVLMVILFSPILLGSKNKNERDLNYRESRVVKKVFKSEDWKKVNLKKGFIITIRKKIVNEGKIFLAEYAENMKDYLSDKDEKEYICVHEEDLQNETEPLDKIKVLTTALKRTHVTTVNEQKFKTILDQLKKENKEKLIQFLMDPESKSLHNVLINGKSEKAKVSTIIHYLLNIFDDEKYKPKLTDYILKVDQFGSTILNDVVFRKNKDLTNLLLKKIDKSKMVKGLLMENKSGDTVFYQASTGNIDADYLNILLEQFDDQQSKTLLFLDLNKKSRINVDYLNSFQKFAKNEEAFQLILEKFDDEKWMKGFMNFHNGEHTHLSMLVTLHRVPTKSIELFLEKLAKYFEKEKMINYIMTTSSAYKQKENHRPYIRYECLNLLISKLMQYGNGNKKILFEFLTKPNEHHRTILHHTVQVGQYHLVDLILEQFDEKKDLIKYLRIKDSKKNTALHLCGDVGIAEQLLKKIDDEEDFINLIRTQNKFGDTMLTLSIQKNHLIVDFLLLKLTNMNKYEKIIEFIQSKNTYDRKTIVEFARQHSPNCAKKIIALHHEISKKYVSKLQTMFNQLVNQQVFFKIVASYLIQKFEY